MGVVIQMDVLNPRYVVPLVAPDGAVFYQVSMSPLQVSPLDTFVVPARDMIHDRGITSWHPLIGMTPIQACASSATLASAISTNSAAFFGNAARPSVFLSAPAAISKDTAERLKAQTESGYTGANTGKVMVGGDGLTLQNMTMSGTDAQLIEQLQWTAQDVARCFHVPGHKIGLDTGARAANSSAIYESMYYSDCLQAYLEAIELLLDDGLNLPDGSALRFDTTGLMRMDEGAMHTALKDAVGAGYMSPNEARARTGLAPTKGGDTPYLQQQNYSLAALAKRDSKDPFANPQDAAGGTPSAPTTDDGNQDDEEGNAE
jgi:HK97 family phage portal protein